MKFQLPFVSRKKYEADLAALEASISAICNTGCATARCRGIKQKTNKDGPYGYKPANRNGHTHERPGKRVLVTMRNGEQFIAKFKDTTGKFHLFDDHKKIKSAAIKRMMVVPTDYELEEKLT